MTRVMRDSTTPAAIPVAGTQLVAGYANGLYQWSQADYDRFPAAAHVYIDVTGADPAGCGVLDVETGDATVTTAVAWAKARLALGGTYPPVIYCNRSTLTSLFNAMGAAGLAIGHDESVVYDDAWHAPAPPATEYIVVRLPDGASAKMLSGMVLK